MQRMLLSVLLLLAAAGCSREPVAPEPMRAVRTTVVGSSETKATHEYAAEVKARLEPLLSFRVGGKIAARPVNLGDRVRVGQVLAVLDPQDLRLGQEAAQAALAGARSNLELAEADYKRFKDLREQNFISAAELERREASVKAARSQFDQARAQATVQGNQARYSSLTADAAGVVTAVSVDPGAVVAAGTPVLRVAQDGPRDVVFSVPEDKVDAIRALLGKPGALRVQPWGGGAPFGAAVREVAAATDPVTRTFLVKADVAATELRLGQTATVTIDGSPRSGIIKLPLSALVGTSGRSSVWVVDPQAMTVQQQPVQVAGADGNDVVIASGLQPGQRVVTAGVHVLTPGQKVKLYEPATVAAQ